MTINCQSPDYYVYVTLRQAADSMIAHGCYNAYTLDGGQTGSIIIGNELINPVQFGVERLMSDIFYFATAIPENCIFMSAVDNIPCVAAGKLGTQLDAVLRHSKEDKLSRDVAHSA